jgi:hypothetical protein
MNRIGVIDFETDPFRHGQRIQPFAACFMNDEVEKTFWQRTEVDARHGNQTVKALVAYLDALPEPHIIYAHNGGRFDFYFLLPYLRSAMSIVAGRIVQCYLGKHELRDSFAAVPAPLKAYKKDDMTEEDYQHKFRWPRRNFYEAEITAYMRNDCRYLLELMTGFVSEFGNKITIGSAAMAELRRFHKFQIMVPEVDRAMRSFFFGGRTQCFETGIIEDDLRVYDVNSMYPFAMKTFRHPVSSFPKLMPRIGPRSFFAKIDAVNRGALPMKHKDGSLDFTVRSGTFYASIHEINAGADTGTLDVQKVHYAVDFDQSLSFADFVDHFYLARMEAKRNGDLLRTLFYKLVLNSAYGKFAQNPADFYDYEITDGAMMPVCRTECDPETCRVHWSYVTHHETYMIWRKRPERVENGYYNVATAASITGAARSILLRGLSRAERPIYCDTDSIVCRSLSGNVGGDDLGNWKLEAHGDAMAIAGKKLYALTNAGVGVKKAHKGAKLSYADIFDIARGGQVEWPNPVPKFGLDGSQTFMRRRIRMTSGNGSDFMR